VIVAYSPLSACITEKAVDGGALRVNSKAVETVPPVICMYQTANLNSGDGEVSSAISGTLTFMESPVQPLVISGAIINEAAAAAPQIGRSAAYKAGCSLRPASRVLHGAVIALRSGTKPYPRWK
jgi:hypothetical protein